MSLPFQFVACVDFETFFSDEYTLFKQPTTDYIRDERFEAQSVAIKMWEVGDDPNNAVAYAEHGHEAVASFLRSVDWTKTAFLAHHAQFDGLIATHHFGVYPCFWLDTLSMSRMVFGPDAAGTLKAVTERLGRKGKVHAQALQDVKGVHLADFNPEQLEAFLQYNCDDVDDTAWIYSKMLSIVPEEELKLIDLTVRMYAEPVLLIDGERVEQAYKDEIERKTALFKQCDLDPKTLGSAEKFAEQLRNFGVEPPMKVSLRTKKIAYAFAKGDYEFKQLLQHEDERVRWLVEARLASKSSLVETRSATILKRVGRPTPVYLNYYGARTGRWSGGDGVNWQNLPKYGIGGELRRSLVAPSGCLLIVSDASQIEARTLAWHAGEQEVLDSFARGADRYCVTATDVYGRPINKEDNPRERQVGKTLELGAGFGAGHVKINYMLKIGAMGPPVHQALEETQEVVQVWRAKRARTVQHWKNLYNYAVTAFINGTPCDDGVIGFELHRGNGYMLLPNGAYILYPAPHMAADERADAPGCAREQLTYIGKNGPVKLWGGQVTENATQALARVILGQQMIVMQEELPDTRIALSTHDEVLIVAPERKAQDYARRVNAIMSTTPGWAQGLPLNAATEVSLFYQKS